MLYLFDEGSGNIVNDESGVGIPLNLTVENSEDVLWVPYGLSISSPTIISSSTAAKKVVEACRSTNEITVEAWLKPANTIQDGPARIISLSKDPYYRNFTFGQGLWGDHPSDVFDMRLRTTDTNANGAPSLTTTSGAATTQLTHVVYTRDASGNAKIYVDAVESENTVTGGDFSGWDSGYPIAIGNELTLDRPWLGELHLAAVYNRALTQAEVVQNFSAGPDADINQIPTADFTTSSISGEAPLAVDFDASGSTDPDGGIVSYDWDFGDGTVGSGQIVSHTYEQIGTFTAVLTVTDDQGATGTASAIITVTESGASTPYTLTVTVSGAGTVLKDPDRSEYAEGETVTLTAVAETGYEFSGWSGDVTGTDSPAVLVMTDDCTVFADFVQSASPPVDAVVSDDFNANNLNADLWTLVDPWGDAAVMIEGAGTGDAKLLFSVPAGISHDPWNGNNATRLLQPAPDTDFAVEVKFDSPVVEKYQDQGIIIEESEDHWLRFDFFSNGSTWVFASGTINGISTSLVAQRIYVGVPLYLKVERTGNQWTESYSANGMDWTVVGTFNYALTVTAIGPYVGNHDANNNAPAHTAVIDYFFNAQYPIVPEDGEVVPDNDTPTADFATSSISGEAPLAVDFDASGSIDPDGGIVSYDWDFGDGTVGSGQIVSNTYEKSGTFTAVLTVTDDQGATGTASAIITVTESGVPAQYTLTVTVSGAGTVLKDPDRSEYAEGETVTLTAVAETGYEFSGWSGDVTGTDSPAVLVMTDDSTVFADFVQSASPPVDAVVSDDFNANNLNADLWTLVDPWGDAAVMIEGAGTGDSKLLFSVPAGISHDPWNGNNATRLLQPAPDTDFAVEVKFDSPVVEKYQDQGIIIEESNNNWLRFDFLSDGISTRVFAARTTNGVSTALIDQRIYEEFSLYLKVERTGNQWTESYSANGMDWTVAGTFNYALTVTAVGPYVGNHDANNNAPAHTAVIDYFFNQQYPVIIEDDPNITAYDGSPPLLQRLEYSVNLISLKVTWITDEPASGGIEYGQTQQFELGKVNHTNAVYLHEITVPDLVPDTRYYFRVFSEDSSGNQSFSKTYEIQTLPPDETPPAIDVWYGPYQRFGHIGTSQRWINILGNVSDLNGVSSLTYSLNNGPENILTVGPDGYRLEEDGDFNIEISNSDLLDGNNQISIKAIDTLQNEVIEPVTVFYESDNIWPESYTVDWSSYVSIEEVAQNAQIVDGLWTLESSGTVRTVNPGYDRLIALGDISWDNYEVTIPLIVHSTEYVPGNSPAVGVIIRWSGHTMDGKQPSQQWWPIGVFGMYRFQGDSSIFQLYDVDYQIIDQNAQQMELEIQYIFKLRAETVAGNSLYRFKIWKSQDLEPSEWTIAHQEEPPDQVQGSVILAAHYVDASFGNVTITPILP